MCVQLTLEQQTTALATKLDLCPFFDLTRGQEEGTSCSSMERVEWENDACCMGQWASLGKQLLWPAGLICLADFPLLLPGKDWSLSQYGKWQCCFCISNDDEQSMFGIDSRDSCDIICKPSIVSKNWEKAAILFSGPLLRKWSCF
eukprot:1144912-Pelagomonas_calceolata.AAC.1